MNKPEKLLPSPHEPLPGDGGKHLSLVLALLLISYRSSEPNTTMWKETFCKG